MRKAGYVVKRLAVAPAACAAIRRNALAQARAPTAPAWRKWLGLDKLHEGVDGGPHGRLLIPLAPGDDGVGDILTKALAAVGTDAVADAGLTSKALLVELSVLAVLPRAAAQPPHLDVLPRDGLAMATLFIPLQDVCASNGATVLYPAPPAEVSTRRDWTALHKENERTYSPDGAADDEDPAAIQAEAAGLLPPVASPWSKFSPSDLGLGEPACLAMSVGDVALMDHRCFHNGGANASEDLRCVMYATFSNEGDHHSYSLESKAQTRRLGEFLSAARPKPKPRTSV